MSYEVQVAPPTHHGWLEAQLQRPLGADVIAMEAVDEHGDIKGMLAFEWWSPGAVGVHVAVATPLALRKTAKVLQFALSLRPVLWALVADGAPSLKLALRVGFKVVGRVPSGYSEGRDLVLVALSKEK